MRKTSLILLATGFAFFLFGDCFSAEGWDTVDSDLRPTNIDGNWTVAYGRDTVKSDPPPTTVARRARTRQGGDAVESDLPPTTNKLIKNQVKSVSFFSVSKIRAEKAKLEEFLIAKMPETHRLLKKMREDRLSELEKIWKVRDALAAFGENPDTASRVQKLRIGYNMRAYRCAFLQWKIEEAYLSSIVGDNSNSIQTDLEVAKSVSEINIVQDYFSEEKQSLLAKKILSENGDFSKEDWMEFVDEKYLTDCAIRCESVEKIVFCIDRIFSPIYLKEISERANSQFAREYALQGR